MSDSVRLTFVPTNDFDVEKYIDIVLRFVEDLRQQGRAHELPTDSDDDLVEALRRALGITVDQASTNDGGVQPA